MQTYLYCNNCTLGQASVVVNATTSPCVNIFLNNSRLYYEKIDNTSITVTIPSAITCDLTVRIQKSVNDLQYGTINSFFEVVIPAGQTSASATNLECFFEKYDVSVSNKILFNVITRFNRVRRITTYSLAAQNQLPNCSQNVGCNLIIASVSVVRPSTTNASNGSLTVTVAGATGGTVNYRLNNGTPQTSNVFTGLKSGQYTVRVTQGGCYNTRVVNIPDGIFQSGTFLQEDPAKIVASENPIIFTVNTPVFDGISLPAKCSFRITALPFNNHKLVISLTSPIQYTAEFFAKDLPNKSNFFLSDTLRDTSNVVVRNNTIAEVAVSLQEAMLEDLVLSKLYHITVENNNTVVLTAKQASNRFTISSTNISNFNPLGVVTTTGITFNQIQRGTDFYQGALVDDYNLYLEIYAPREPVQFTDVDSSINFNDFVRVTDVTLPYQIDNEHKFQVETICKSFVYTPKPDFEYSGYTINDTYIQPFYFKYGEFYPLIPNTNTKKKFLKGESISSKKPIWVMNASIDYQLANDMTYFTGQTIDTRLRNVPFLTNSPQVKQSTKLQRELLYFLLPKDLNEGRIDVRGDITFWDGSQLNNQTFFVITTGSTNQGGAMLINVSFERLGLPAIEISQNKLIKQVTIRVLSGNGIRNLTLDKSYLYDLEEPVNRLGLAFLNKLGTFDTFDFRGQIDFNINREAKSYTVPRNPKRDGSLENGFKYNADYDVRVTNKLTVNSGWVNQQTFDWLKELLSSNEIYIYSTEYDNYVTITGFKYNKSSRDNQYNLEIELTYTIQDNNVSI
jgi:hypothetical protein